MALVISSTAEAEVKIAGTDIVLESIYSRIAFGVGEDGSSVHAILHMYASEDKYAEGKKLTIENQISSLCTSLDPVEMGNILLAVHYKYMSYLIGLGFSVEVVDI